MEDRRSGERVHLGEEAGAWVDVRAAAEGADGALEMHFPQSRVVRKAAPPTTRKKMPVIRRAKDISTLSVSASSIPPWTCGRGVSKSTAEVFPGRSGTSSGSTGFSSTGFSSMDQAGVPSCCDTATKRRRASTTPTSPPVAVARASLYLSIRAEKVSARICPTFRRTSPRSGPSSSGAASPGHRKLAMAARERTTPAPGPSRGAAKASG
mmetsp:Transcript_39520/g.92352  ORF Transcript_39520/g.92352 Transcript_39520/m.92352 type:complete len:209 (-) Transcript_39520:1315-1941(-)